MASVGSVGRLLRPPVLTGPLFAAYCKNSVDGLWYCFDDSYVQQLSEDEVCTQTAYILFYQRRTAVPSWSANSSVAGEADEKLAGRSRDWCEHINPLMTLVRSHTRWH